MNTSHWCSRLPSLTTLLVAIVIGGDATGNTLFTKAPNWQLHDGERIVLLGDGLFERDGQLGFLETALVTTFSEANLEFRNLGWGGDTVWAESRGVFDPPAKGYARMLGLINELAPDVIFVAYGRNESFANDRQLEAFEKQLDKLCSDLCQRENEQSDSLPRLVLITPSPFERRPTCPDSKARNTVLASYATVIRETAAVRHAGLIDLFNAWPQSTDNTPFTTDGMHLSPGGYQTAAQLFVKAAGRRLPDKWANRSATVRECVNKKNQLFFHRWRPANETYLFLFRKHEQGNNAAEILRFDPLVVEAEAAVRAARDTMLDIGVLR